MRAAAFSCHAQALAKADAAITEDVRQYAAQREIYEARGDRADFTRKRKSFGEPGPRYTQSADLIEEVRGFAHRLRPFVEAPPF